MLVASPDSPCQARMVQQGCPKLACRLLLAFVLLPSSTLPVAALASSQVSQTSQGGLSVFASRAEPVQLWDRVQRSAAQAAVEALARHDKGHELQLVASGVEHLRIWNGQSVVLAVEADGQVYRWAVQSEPEWRSLAEVLPASQGGLLPETDWEGVGQHWMLPASRGSLLPDFVLEGPVDLTLAAPTQLQLYLPHSTDLGRVQRVLLREGAAVLVRGATSVRLRRGVDLPAMSLSQFAGIVTSEAAAQQPEGVLHLLAGVREQAAAQWNVSHPDQSPGVVSLELSFGQAGGSLLATPAAAVGSGGGRPQRLRARVLAPGVIELTARDANAAAAVAASAAAQGAAALAVPGAPDLLRRPWPLRSLGPSHLQAYERLLREVVASRLFQGVAGGGGSSSTGAAGLPALRVAHDVQLRLLETRAEATTLLQLQLELQRRPKLAAASREDRTRSGGGRRDRVGAPPEWRHQQQQEEIVAVEDPPDIMSVLAQPRTGPHETWVATVQVKMQASSGGGGGDGSSGLQFVPLQLQRVGVSHDTVQLAPGALQSLLGNASMVRWAM